LVLEGNLWQIYTFSPWSFDFLTFDGFGFDHWIKLVPELWILDKRSFNVDLFGEKLLPDPALSCGF
nr:hypothetical protein [Tanacetum cinerariifolium]